MSSVTSNENPFTEAEKAFCFWLFVQLYADLGSDATARRPWNPRAFLSLTLLKHAGHVYPLSKVCI